MEIKSKDIRIVDIDSLVPNPKNNNKHPPEQIERLAKLIKYQGFRNPLVVSNRSGFVLCGHGRIEAARKAGLKEVPVMYQDFDSEAQEYAYLTSDNAIASWSELDLSAVNMEMLDLGPDFDIDLLGIKDFVIEPIEKFEPKSDEDDVPEVVHPITRKGDIWLLGKHRLMCGDSTMIDDVERLMNGEKADLVVTDPPYNVAVNDESEESLKDRNRRTDGLKIKNDKMSDDDFLQFLSAVFTNYHVVMREGAGIYVFYADSMTIPFMQTFIEAGFHFAQNCIWNKQQFVMTRKDYHYKHEPVMYGWKLGKAHEWYTDRKQSSVWNFDRPFRNPLHPTMKPIDLIDYPIGNSSKKGDLVLDLFGGSGSTLISCSKLGRRCNLMELDEKYCDVIVNRWEEFTGDKAKIEATGQTYEELRASREEV
jgi:DNA modification methylase